MRLRILLFALVALGIIRIGWDIPTIKTLSGTQTVVSTQSFFTGGYSPGSGSPTINSSNHKAKMSGIFPNGVGWYNTGGIKWYFINDASTTTTIGTSSSNAGFATQNGSNDIHFYGADLTHPFIFMAGVNNGESGGANAIQGIPSTTGGNYVLEYVFVDGAQSSGIQINGDGTSTYYDTITVSNTWVVNVGQEGAYNGATHTSPAYAPIHYLRYRNFIAVITGRENFQDEHNDDGDADGITGILSGQNNVGGQNNGWQWHDNKGYFRNFILDSVKGPAFNIFGGGHITNGRVRYFASTAGGGADYAFIGDVTSSQYGVTSRTNLTDTLVVRDVDFEYIGAGTVAKLFSWNEKVFHVKFINCRKSANITAWYTDDRVSHTGTGSLTFVNCTDFTPPPAPKFMSYNRYNYAFYYHLLPTALADDDYKRGRGAFTPRGRAK